MSQISARPEKKINHVLCINQMPHQSRGPSHHRKHSVVVDDVLDNHDSKYPAHDSGAPSVS
ncbi:hypothetical protein A2U01_0107934 [Trifolium medium]|uniref:Uncharacterized protein n=1 Tax=Trifolium medium TaxID=97028 RepID=A0A392VGR0_9FABA|nr:hypothetical protein [Trifolium medium]